MADPTTTKIVIGCDHLGLEVKDALVAHLTGQGWGITDLGVKSHEPVDYPDISMATPEATGDKSGLNGQGPPKREGRSRAAGMVMASAAAPLPCVILLVLPMRVRRLRQNRRRCGQSLAA